MTNFFASASLDHMEARGAAIQFIIRLISGFVGGISKRLRPTLRVEIPEEVAHLALRCAIAQPSVPVRARPAFKP
jgi:hypothetical protein